MSESTTAWYIIKIANHTCQIVTQEAILQGSGSASENVDSEAIDRWGPYESQSEAIAKRVGLIRAGKCQPI
jgi:hypothetical protein